jgi:hypothetical protein
MWASLLHDIKKRGEGHFDGKDLIHPFMSGSATLIILETYGFLRHECPDYSQDQMDLVLTLIEESKKELLHHAPGTCPHIQSYHNLPQIFGVLWYSKTPILKRGSFCDLVFRLVFFHQSLCGLSHFRGVLK